MRVRGVEPLCGVLAGTVALHIALLGLPFFWDEAGYYIPAARDFFLTGSLIPHTTLHTAHTPLLSILLAAVWKIVGYGIVITRVSMLAVACFGLWQVFRLAENVSNRSVAVAATLLTALYPVVFAQSTLAHSDLLATALAWWGLREYFEREPRFWRYALAFTLAVLAKEIVVIVPAALAAWALLADRDWRRAAASLGAPAIVLLLWFGYQRANTGAWFGDPDYYRYNVSAAIAPQRVLLAFVQRAWQAFGHMQMWLATVTMLAAMLLVPKPGRDRIAIPIQLQFGAIILAILLFNSVLGGALLTRYLLPAFPLVLIVAASTWWRRAPHWEWLAAAIAVAFLVSCYIDPPYRCAPEDNLNYADFVRLHQHAVHQMETQYPRAEILTAWPMSDELARPELGYSATPHPVKTIKNFTPEEIAAANKESFDVAVVFSTKYEPKHPLFQSRWWLAMSARFFDYHRDLRAVDIALMLNGSLVWQEERGGHWVAIIARPQALNAERRFQDSIDHGNRSVR
jgi:Dolichyl-phosphate-mannose-protein mannosyltransferase